MKFTLSWLNKYLDTSAPSITTADQIIETLTDIGLEVEEVENKAAIYAPFKVAKVKSAVQHPDADRLRVCQVETADGIIQVVCGAPNAKEGMSGIFAPTGSYIPGLDVTLQKGVIRGQESHGMLVSEREMCISDEHNGIIELDDKYSIGTPITDVFENLDDVIIDIALTPDRADCAGIMGIARDLAAAGCGKFIQPEQSKITDAFETTIKITIDNPDACPNFLGRQIKGVKNCESPAWLKQQLEAVGLRPISALVDITNYFCIGLNRPLHVYDVSKLQGNIHITQADGGEKLDALNDKSYVLNGGETVITDEHGVIGLGGIVGGTSTSCEMDATDILLECAYFDAVNIATTGRKLQIITDARYRFERGVDPEFLGRGINLAAQMIVELCGGEIGSLVTAGQPIKWQRTYDFNPELTKKLTGVEISDKEQLYILGSLGFTIDGSSAPYTIQPPSWRPDILGVADLVEEIIRIYGFENIEAIPVRRETPLTQNALSKTHSLRMLAGRTLANIGLQECITWSFMQHKLATSFADNISPSLRLTNALSTEMDTMRPSILPNLIQAVAKNADKGYPNAALFETGPVFHGVDPSDQMTVAAGVRHGVHGNKHWASNDVSRPVDTYDAKADAIAVIKSINPSLKPQISTDAPSYYHPGRSGVLRLGKNVLANFGETHPSILEDIDIKGTVVGFEVMLENIPTAKKSNASRKALNLSSLHPITRDFAFLVDEGVNADTIKNAAKKGGGELVTDVSIFDVYQGKNVPEGQKSVAIAMSFTPTEKTLTDKEIEALSKSVIDQVTVKTGAVLRG